MKNWTMFKQKNKDKKFRYNLANWKGMTINRTLKEKYTTFKKI